MNKKISILGIQVDNYTVEEAISQVELYLSSTGMNTVAAISMDVLVQAQEDEEIKKCIEALDLTIISEKELLKAAGIKSAERIKEITDNVFLSEFLNRIVLNEKKVYLLGKTRAQLAVFHDYLLTVNEQLCILGSYAMEECVGDFDGAVNEINIATPDVVLSVLPTPLKERFIDENKGKLNAQIWYGLDENCVAVGGVDQVKKVARKIIQKGKLLGMLSKYKRGD